MFKTYIENFIKSIDEELNVSFIEKDGWNFETTSNTVNVAISDTEDCGFFRHLKEEHKCEFANEFSLTLWSILHEIGHYETEDFVDFDEELDDRVMLYLTDDVVKTNKKIQNKYYNLPSEWEATEWAIEWITENWELATEFDQNFPKGV